MLDLSLVGQVCLAYCLLIIRVLQLVNGHVINLVLLEISISLFVLVLPGWAIEFNHT